MLYPEVAFILSKLGRTIDAIRILLYELKNVSEAIRFVEMIDNSNSNNNNSMSSSASTSTSQQKSVLWREMINLCSKDVHLMTQLLGYVGSVSINPSEIIAKLPDSYSTLSSSQSTKSSTSPRDSRDSRDSARSHQSNKSNASNMSNKEDTEMVPVTLCDLKPRLNSIFKHYELYTTLHDCSNTALAHDTLTLVRLRNQSQAKAMRISHKSNCCYCHKPLFILPPSSVLQTLHSNSHSLNTLTSTPTDDELKLLWRKNEVVVSSTTSMHKLCLYASQMTQVLPS